MRIIEHRRSAVPAAAGVTALYLRQGMLLPPAAPGTTPPVDAETLIFATTRLRLALNISGLYSRENVRLDLTVRLAFSIVEPRQFYQDIVREPRSYDEEELAATLANMLVTALRPPVAHASVAELNADPNLRAWLETAVRSSLQEIDLEGRSGLHVEALEAYDLRCLVTDEQERAQGTLYLGAAPGGSEANRPLVDRSVLESLRQPSAWASPASEPMQGAPAAKGKDASALDTQSIRSMLRNPPSVMRPELWRCALGAEVQTAPLCDEQHVYVATRNGEVHALRLADGAAAWPQPARLNTMPADSMLLAAGCLWVGGRDGVLYGLRPSGGAIIHRIAIGGRLSSAPVLVDNLLYLSVDVEKERLEDKAAGSIACIDPNTGQRVDMRRISTHGLRAQPVQYEHALFVGDRQGTLHRLSLRTGISEALAPLRLGRILAPVAVDGRRKQLIVGGSYGAAIVDGSGQVRAVERLDGNNVGVAAQPLVLGDTVFVGATDSQVHILHAKDLKQRSKPFATGGPVATSPIPVRHLVVVGSNDGYLYALDAQSGQRFWSYRSGQPIAVAPAVTGDDILIAVDCQGNVNALRWCLTEYHSAVRLARASNPPRLDEAIELLLLAQEQDEAMDVAEQAKRWDVVARLATDLQLSRRAATAWENLAKTQTVPTAGAQAWRRAAQQWLLDGDEQRSQQCLLKAADLRKAPLLTMQALDLPAMMQGQSSDIHVRIKNLSERSASHVHLRCSGHIANCDLPEFGLEGKTERTVKIGVQPTHSGSATLEFHLTYSDSSNQPQDPLQMQVRLAIAQPPIVQNNYYGPMVRGDGVIMMRGDDLRSLGLDSADAAPHSSGEQPLTFCPYCKQQTMRGLRCDQCGRTL
jgi:outer membrane protein assembly factor BamB